MGKDEQSDLGVGSSLIMPGTVDLELDCLFSGDIGCLSSLMQDFSRDLKTGKLVSLRLFLLR